MDFLRKYLTTIQAQLKGLTVSQKLLIALLVVVMVGTIFFTVTLSAKPEMVVLIPQSMSAEDINRAEMFLKGKYEYQVQGDKILVPADKAYGIRGELFAAQALPKDTTEAFATMVRETNIFQSETATSREWNVALAETLSKMMRGFPYVADATVVIAQGERSGLGRDAIPSSATVTLRTRSGEGLTSAQVGAIADMVQGAVAGMKRKDVKIIDGLRSYQAPNEDMPMPADMLAFKHSIEDDLSAKLYRMFSEFGDVKIAVNAVPDLSIRNQTKESYDPKPVKAVTNETGNETSLSEGTGSGEPGVKPNVSANADDTGGGHKSLNKTSETTETSEVRFGKTTETAVLPAGTELKDLTASISIPRSYFVSIYRRIAHDPKADPDDDKLQPTIDAQLKRAQMQAKNTIGAASDKQISVDWFDDTLVPHPSDVALAGVSASNGVPALVGQYAKQGVLGLVALGVLGMMLMMVRRAAPGGAAGDIDPGVFFGTGGASSGGKAKRKPTDPGAMDVGDDVFGEANSGEAVLTGIELDDVTLQSRKMVDEVSVMIKDSPENAASLVKRWMAKGK